MLSATKPRPHLDVETVRSAAAGRWPAILASVGGLDPALLDGKHHACPKCGGKDRFRLIDADAGVVFCNQCFSTHNGDGFAALQWLTDCDFPAAIKLVGDHLGLHQTNGRATPRHKAPTADEVLATVCRAKRIPIPSAVVYGARATHWGRQWVVEFPVYGPDGQQCSRFALPADGVSKGLNARGSPAGLFLPHVDGKPRLPQAGETWRMVEGAKDAAALHGLGWLVVGLPTSAMNAKFAQLFQGVDIKIAPDLDAAGQKGATKTAARLQGIAASVRITRWPGEIRESNGIDARDVLAMSDGEALVVQADNDAQPANGVGDGRPEIDAGIKDLSVITPLAWTALQWGNDPATLFRYGGCASRIETGDRDEPIIKPLDFARMRHHLARVAAWIVSGEGDEERSIAPPKDVVTDVLATPDHPLPVLGRIVEAPVFAPDGTLQTVPGYHPQSQTYYAPADGFTVPDVPERPEGIDVESARNFILDELLGDFPFIGNAEQAHAAALLLLPFARSLIDGPTPLHLFEKPSPGTGATLLVDMLCMPSTGRPITTMTEGRDEDEWRKRITAKLCGGAPFVLIDNLRRRLDSAAVSAGITSTTWEDRILGGSIMARLPVRCCWIATGNNPAVSTEIARRTLRIRLDAKLDRPWLRSGFRHDNLRQWAMDHRGDLVWSALTLIRAWLVAGRPAGKQTLGMFERWSEVMGGIFAVVGIPGFLGNLSEFYEESDAEGATWRAFLTLWWDRFRDAERTVKELWQIASDDACLPLGDKGEQSQRIVLGKMLAERRDRVFDLELDGTPARLCIARGGTYRRAVLWRLRRGEV